MRRTVRHPNQASGTRKVVERGSSKCVSTVIRSMRFHHKRTQDARGSTACSSGGRGGAHLRSASRPAARKTRLLRERPAPRPGRDRRRRVPPAAAAATARRPRRARRDVVPPLDGAPRRRRRPPAVPGLAPRERRVPSPRPGRGRRGDPPRLGHAQLHRSASGRRRGREEVPRFVWVPRCLSALSRA